MFESEERRGLVFTLIGGGLLVLALLIGLGFFSSPAPPDSESAAGAQRGASPALRLAAVRARVLDARTGFGLASPRVEVRGLDGLSDHWLAPLEDAAPGAVELRGLPAATRCTIALTADGYVEATREVEVAAGATKDLGDVALTPLAALFGQVVDAMEAGLAPARVELCSLDGKVQTAEVDAHGGFRFEQLAPADYLLRARTEAGETPIAPLSIDAKSGGERRGIVLTLFPTVALRGTFKMPVGCAPLAGVVAQGRRGTVKGDGTFVVEEIRAGPTRLVALIADDSGKEGGVAFDVGAPLHDVDFADNPVLGVDLAVDPAAATELEVALAAPRLFAVSPVDPAAQLDATIIVRVVDMTGARIGGALVELVEESGAEAASPIVTRIASTFATRGGECVLHAVVGRGTAIHAYFGALAGATLLPPLQANATRELIVTLAPAAEVR